jgi:molybdenum cofactor synthesis domain-containing protein
MHVSTIYKTGVEVEAMHGVSVVALTMYDMLKPIDKEIEISTIKLVAKKGGKSDFKDKFRKYLKAAVLVCSDSISAGQKEDRAGKAIIEKLEGFGVSIAHYGIIPDEKENIQAEVKKHVSSGCNLIIFTGGTGLSSRDVTPEALEEILERRIPGMEEAIRNYGQQRTPYSMLSRSIVGTLGKTLVMGLPGSTNGATESMDAIFPAALHVIKIMGGGRHD